MIGRAIITSTLLVSAVTWADDKPKTEGAPGADTKVEVGEDKGVTEKISQGVKNVLSNPKLEDLPAAVQKTIQDQSQGAKISDIDREDRTGRTVYEVEFENEGNNREIHIASDGTLMSQDQVRTQMGWDTETDRTRVRDAKNLKLTDLPAAVQATAKQHGADAEVEDIDTYRRDGKLVYEIEFRRDGPNREIHVAQDGSLMDVKQIGAPGTETGTDSGVRRSDPSIPSVSEPAVPKEQK
jgi:uncharacterized membrane protein YkoI